MAPASGTSVGATAFTITGTNFVSGARVTFGGATSPIAAVITSQSIMATTPAHGAGPVSVAVVNPDGQMATKANAFTYLAAPAPTVASIAPATGPGGTEITITGTGFANTNGATKNAIVAAYVSVGTPTCTLVKVGLADGTLPDNSFGHDMHHIFVEYATALGTIRRGILKNDQATFKSGADALARAVTDFATITARMNATP